MAPAARPAPPPAARASASPPGAVRDRPPTGRRRRRSCGGGPRADEFAQVLELRIGDAELGQPLERLHQVVGVRPGAARGRQDALGLLLRAEAARILLMRAVDDVAERLAAIAPARAIAEQRHRVERLEIGVGDELALREIVAHMGVLAGADPEGGTDAG